MGDATVLDGHEDRALRPLLADRAALEIAGEDHQRIFGDNLEIMNMAERPVVVAARAQVLDRARRIGRVRLAAGERGVQHADIKPALFRPRIGERQVFDGRTFGKALAVQRHLQMVQPEAARLVDRELADILRQGDRLGDDAFGVVIALQQEDGDTGAFQPRHFAVEEQADLVVLPVTVIDVAGNDEEVHLAFDRLIDQS